MIPKFKQKVIPKALLLAKENFCEKYNNVVEPVKFLMPCEVPDYFFRKVKKVVYNSEKQ